MCSSVRGPESPGCFGERRLEIVVQEAVKMPVKQMTSPPDSASRLENDSVCPSRAKQHKPQPRSSPMSQTCSVYRI